MKQIYCEQCGAIPATVNNEIELVCEKCKSQTFRFDDMEPIYKVFDARNRLMFVTPFLKNAKEFITKEFDVVFSNEGSINYGRLLYGACRVEKQFQPKHEI